MNAQDQIYLQNTQVQLANLVVHLQQISQNNPDRRVFVRGDKDVSYGDMLQVMATITQGGFTPCRASGPAAHPGPLGHAWFSRSGLREVDIAQLALRG